MKRHFGLILITIAVVLGIVLFVQRDHWTDSPMSAERHFEYPQYAAEGKEGSLYILDGAMRRVSRLEPDGTITYTLTGGSREEGSFFYTEDYAVDAEGNLYLLNYVLDQGGMFMEREEIQRYTPQGRYAGTVYRREYDQPASTRVQRGEIEALVADEEGVRFVERQNDQLIGYELRPSRYIPREIGSIGLADAPQVLGDVAWDGSDGLLISTKFGTIERAEWDGDWIVLFADADHERRIVPWELGLHDDGAIAFVDLANRSIRTLDRDGNLDTVVDRERIQAAGFAAEDSIFYRLSQAHDGGLITADEFAVVVYRDGEIEQFIETGTLSDRQMVLRWLGWGVAGLAALLFVVGLGAVYVRLLERRLSLIVKQLLVLVPVVLIAVVGVSTWLIKDGVDRVTDEYLMRISAMAQAFGSAADASLFDEITAQEDFWNDDYRSIRDRFHGLIRGNADPWNEDVYFALYKVEGNDLYGFMYQNDRIGMYHPFPWFDDPNSVYRQAAQGRTASEIVTDVSGDWLYAVAPIEKEDGELAGIVEVGTDLYSFQLENQALVYRTIWMVSGITVVIVLLLVLSTYMVLRSIRALRRGVAAVAGGNWDTQVAVRSNDEVFELAATFNEMARSIQGYMQHIEEMNASYRRFVPEQFISFLGRPNVVTTSLGDQVDREMTVLFSDIRSFTKISEQMTPKENFDFLNTYLARVGPFVRSHNGFVDKYIGDAIMALFPDSPDDAVSASVEIERALFELNRERKEDGLAPIDIGVGIHTGHLMLGIVGEVERLQATVIADAVNVAARLEGLTSQLGAGILISGESFDHLVDSEAYLYRYIGQAQVKGRSSTLRIYEILDGQPNSDRIDKIRTREIFNEGVSLFGSRQFEAAAERFAEVLKIDPDDRAAVVYGRSCEHYAQHGTPEGWDGVLVFDEK